MSVNKKRRPGGPTPRRQRSKNQRGTSPQSKSTTKRRRFQELTLAEAVELEREYISRKNKTDVVKNRCDIYTTGRIVSSIRQELGIDGGAADG